MGGLGKLDKVAQDLANKLLEELGGTCDIEIEGTAVLDSYTGLPTGAFGEPTVILDIPCEPPQKYASNLINGTTILMGDAKTSISHSSLAGNILRENNSYFILKDKNYSTGVVVEKRYKIIKIIPIMGGNSTALIEMQIRS
jgi:hypothetical protein